MSDIANSLFEKGKFYALALKDKKERCFAENIILQQQLEALKIKYTEFEKDICEKKILDVKRKYEKLKKKDTENPEVKEALRICEEKNIVLQQKFDDLSKACEQGKQDLQKMQQLQQENETLRSLCQPGEEKEDGDEKDEKELDRLTSDLSEKEKIIDDMEQELAENKTLIENLQAQNSALQQELTNTETEIDELNREFEKLEKRCEEAHKQDVGYTEATKALFDEAHESEKKLEKETNQLRMENKKIKAENTSLMQKLEENTTNFSDVERLKSELQKSRREISVVTNKLQECQRERKEEEESFSNEMKEMFKLLEEYKRSIGLLESRCASPPSE
jgi:chromosome segregation ATPase